SRKVSAGTAEFSGMQAEPVGGLDAHEHIRRFMFALGHLVFLVAHLDEVGSALFSTNLILDNEVAVNGSWLELRRHLFKKDIRNRLGDSSTSGAGQASHRRRANGFCLCWSWRWLSAGANRCGDLGRPLSPFRLVLDRRLGTRFPLSRVPPSRFGFRNEKLT